MTKEVAVSTASLQNFGLARCQKHHSAPVNSIDFSDDGDFLLTSGDDKSLHYYRLSPSAKREKTIFDTRHGIANAHFTHHNECVVFSGVSSSSTDPKGSSDVRYVSLHDNVAIQTFKGHKQRVTTVAVSPLNDTLISGSANDTVRFWDLRDSKCCGIMEVDGLPAVAFDRVGMVFAVAADPNVIRLYDAKAYQKGPFATFHIDSDRAQFTKLDFSLDGKRLLACTNTNFQVCVDSFTGNTHGSFDGFQNDQGACVGAFAPDSQHVLSGSGDGSVHVWDSSGGSLVCSWKGHAQAVRRVAFNPVHSLVASADTTLCLWLPQGN